MRRFCVRGVVVSLGVVLGWGAVIEGIVGFEASARTTPNHHHRPCGDGISVLLCTIQSQLTDLKKRFFRYKSTLNKSRQHTNNLYNANQPDNLNAHEYLNTTYIQSTNLLIPEANTW